MEVSVWTQLSVWCFIYTYIHQVALVVKNPPANAGDVRDSGYYYFFKTLHNCISFAKYQNESATGIHVFPFLNPPPSSLPIPSLWVVPVHQPQASSIAHQTWTGNSFHTWYFTCWRSPGGGYRNPLQYSCLGNPMDRGAWWATVHKVAKSWTQLKRLSKTHIYL